MKKLTLQLSLLAVFAAISFGCSESAVSTGRNSNDNISLIAPNGERVYKDMGSLNEEVRLIIAESFGDDIPFKILSVEYTDVYDGYYAIVTYRLENGITSNYAVSNSWSVFANTSVNEWIVECNSTEVEYIISDDADSVVCKSQDVQNYKTVFTCKSETGCSPCKVHQVLEVNDPNKTVIKTTCTQECVDCYLTAKTTVTVEDPVIRP